MKTSTTTLHPRSAGERATWRPGPWVYGIAIGWLVLLATVLPMGAAGYGQPGADTADDAAPVPII